MCRGSAVGVHDHGGRVAGGDRIEVHEQLLEPVGHLEEVGVVLFQVLLAAHPLPQRLLGTAEIEGAVRDGKVVVERVEQAGHVLRCDAVGCCVAGDDGRPVPVGDDRSGREFLSCPVRGVEQAGQVETELWQSA